MICLTKDVQGKSRVDESVSNTEVGTRRIPAQ